MIISTSQSTIKLANKDNESNGKYLSYQIRYYPFVKIFFIQIFYYLKK